MLGHVVELELEAGSFFAAFVAQLMDHNERCLILHIFELGNYNGSVGWCQHALGDGALECPLAWVVLYLGDDGRTNSEVYLPFQLLSISSESSSNPDR